MPVNIGRPGHGDTISDIVQSLFPYYFCPPTPLEGGRGANLVKEMLIRIIIEVI